MTEKDIVSIDRLPTGVPGLDAVLGGGLPEYSFNLIAGEPGAGKTTLAQQIMFANASSDRRALYFTVLGEPTLKMLRYQQQFSFFRPDLLDDVVRFVNLSDEVLEQDLEKVLDRVTREVEATRPGLVVVDSFRTVVRAAARMAEAEVHLQSFVQRLAVRLTSWQVTSFLVGEYAAVEMRHNPVFTVADGILWLAQAEEGNAIVRKLHVKKIRGQSPRPGMHSFRITGDGIRVFPRMTEIPSEAIERRPGERISSGVSQLDEMMNGGIPAGDAVLVAGPSGSGKTLLATQFTVEGLRRDEPAVIAIFEEYPEEYLNRAEALGLDLRGEVDAGRLRIIRLRPLDLSVDEVLHEIRTAVDELGARRVVIDSLSGFEVGLAPTYRAEFRESLYRMVATLTGMGTTVLMTVEVTEAFAPPRFTPHAISFITDDIIVQRFVELNGYIQSVMGVVKMRRSDHSRALRLYEVTPEGIHMGMVLRGYEGIITGVPVVRDRPTRPAFRGLTDAESAVLESLMEIREGAADALGRQTGIAQSALVSALERLVELGYVDVAAQDGETVYRYTEQPRDSERES